ncbi:MAG TPA: peptidoglycan DD-metalloendopeptidase family protein, partial [Thermosynechococcaceae cyanobacterium]
MIRLVRWEMIRSVRSVLKSLKLKSHFWVGLSLLSLSLLLVIGFPGVAQPTLLAQTTGLETLQQQQQQIDQQRSQIEQERDRLRSLERTTQGNLNGLQQTIQATDSQIQASQARLETAMKELKTLEASLAKTERFYQQRQVSTVARLRFLQRQPIDRGWAVLLQSQNLNQFLDRRHQLRRVYQADQKMLSSLKTETERVDRHRNQVEQKKNEIALLTQRLLAQKADIQAEATAQKALITRLKGDRRALEAAEAQLARDSQNVVALIQQKISAQNAIGITLRGTGQMVVPSTGEITSAFGWRLHPILGYEKFHAGVDFGANYGSTISAADRGTVIFAGWYGGYGNTVIIDHGGSITTLYAHASEFY